MSHSLTLPQVGSRTLHPVVLHPKLNHAFVATNSKGKQIAVQVHDCRYGEVYYMIWKDGGGLFGSPRRCKLKLWSRQLSDAKIDSSRKAWRAFNDKQNPTIQTGGTPRDS